MSARPDTTPKSHRLPPPSKPARRSDVLYRQAKDRDACELEAAVDSRMSEDRLALIRAAAAKLAGTAGRAPRLALGAPVERQVRVTACTPFDARRMAFQAATAFLKDRCILVSVSDRDAVVRKYRVSGKREPMLACEVIDFAAALGFEVPA